VDLDGLRRRSLAEWYRTELDPSWLQGEGVRLAEYVPAAAVEEIEGEVELVIQRHGELRGLAGWFDAELAPGIGLTNAPGSGTHWGQVVLPLPPVLADAGDVLRMRVKARETDISWDGELRRGSAIVARYGKAEIGTARLAGAAWRPWSAEEISELNERGAEAFARGEHGEAARIWDEATRGLGPATEELAGGLYENLGIALQMSGKAEAAIRAFLRALDGELGSREQSLRILVIACLAAGRVKEATRFVKVYEERFGKHPDWPAP
jgi:hypothetical protein